MENINIELKKRKRRIGPESNLIDSFLDSFDINSLTKKGTTDLLVLEEPNICNNFPDLIFVLMDKNKIHFWNEDRLLLNNTDIKILHHLYVSKKKKDISDIVFELGYSQKEVIKIIKRLYKAGMLIDSETLIKPKSIKDLFFIKDIISVEAKINNWKCAFNQAALNNIFSSESYILLPDKAVNENVLNQGKEHRIGIISNNEKDNRLIIKSKKNKIPSSYFSWVLNEKIGKALYNAC